MNKLKTFLIRYLSGHLLAAIATVGYFTLLTPGLIVQIVYALIITCKPGRTIKAGNDAESKAKHTSDEYADIFQWWNHLDLQIAVILDKAANVTFPLLFRILLQKWSETPSYRFGSHRETPSAK